MNNVSIDDIKITILGTDIYYSHIEAIYENYIIYFGGRVECELSNLQKIKEGKENYELLKLQMSKTDLKEKVQDLIHENVEHIYKTKIENLLNSINENLSQTKNTLNKINNIYEDLERVSEQYKKLDLSTAFKEQCDIIYSLKTARQEFQELNDELKQLFS